MAGSAQKSQVAPLVVAPAHRPGGEAVAEALAQLDYGEAPQIGFLGDTGTGKTTSLKYFIEDYLRRSAGSVFIVDDKEVRPRFEGQYRRDREDLRENRIDWQLGRTTVFRGEPTRAKKVDLEEIAELAWVRAGKSRKTLLVFDELISGRPYLTKNAQWRSGVEWVPQGFTAGRSAGVGNFWGAQTPQLVPMDPFEESSAIVCFRLAGMGLGKLKEREYLQGGADLVIPRLHGPPDPPASRGDFVVLYRGRPWNGKIYKFREA